MLYRSEAFERLTDREWDADRVRGAVRDVVEDIDRALRGPRLLWRADTWDRWRSTSPQKNLYTGAAGVLWALHELRERGAAETTLDLAELATCALELFRAKPDFIKGWKDLPEPRESSLLEGESGILLVGWRIAQKAELADELLARIRANVDNEADEIMWGAPGTLVAARLMAEWTNEERWRDACRETAEALWSRRREDGLWQQRLYEDEFRSLTPPHGLVGIVQALLPHLDDGRRNLLVRDTNDVLAQTAVVENGLANWPTRIGRDLVATDGEIRVQWCAGAPGMVIAAADYLDEELLLAGAELPWQTGPSNLDKGPGICHGTAGNGYAFLKTFARTGDERWLERARRFAVHALEQVERLRAQRGRGRYSLFTGDVGAALYAVDCLEARSAYPLFG
jgi:lantibiotic modifying enzyme